MRRWSGVREKSIVGPPFDSSAMPSSEVCSLYLSEHEGAYLSPQTCLTPQRTASCPHAAFRLHSKPPPGSDAVARFVSQLCFPLLCVLVHWRFKHSAGL